MSGTHACSQFEWAWMPLIGDLDRSAYPCLSLARRSAAGALVSELDEYLC
jgi:hypothetical protein